MNWLRSKLRAWLCLDLDTAGKEAIVDVFSRRINGAFVLIGQQSTQLEQQQQREICALRGEVAMLKRQVTMQSLPSWTTRFDEQGQRVWADGTMQEVELLKANQQADTAVLTGRGRNVPISISGLNR